MSDPTPSPLEALSAALASLVAAAAPSVVSVRSARSHSSGFAWRPNLIVTADEALAEEGEITVTLDSGESRKATIAGRDPSTDVALLRIEGEGLHPVKFAAELVRPGALALAIGGGSLVHSGVVAVSGPAWQSMRGGDIAARIELDLRLRRQAEGAIVFDAAGRAFGMAVFGPRRRTLVIPAATIERVAAKLERDGQIARGYLGVGLQPVRVEGLGTPGAMIISLDKDGPAIAAGLHQGDVIVSWDGQNLSGVNSLLRALGPDSVGRSVAITVRRGGVALDFTVTVAARPRA